MNKLVYILALLPAMIFMGCQVTYVRPPKGDLAGDITVYQGFSRSAVGAQNTLDAAVTKTSAILTADVSPELNSEINPELNSEINPALASEINPSVAGNSAEINPEIATEVSPELETTLSAEISDLYNETIVEEEVSTDDETEE